MIGLRWRGDEANPGRGRDGAIERRAREILERRQCDWLEAWTRAAEEQEFLDDAARIADRAPGRHPAGHARHAPGRVTLSAQIGVAMRRPPGAAIPGRRASSTALPGPVMRRAERPKIDPEAAELLARARRGGEPLDGALRSRLEASLGTALDDVRIHRDAEADAAARALGRWRSRSATTCSSAPAPTIRTGATASG